MANLSLTAANIRALKEACVRNKTAGGTLTVGDLVYIASDNDVERADASASATAKGIGIVVGSEHGETSIAAGDGVAVCVWGPVAGFSSLTPGDIAYASNDAGKLEDAAGDVTFTVGYAETDEIFFVLPGMAQPTS